MLLGHAYCMYRTIEYLLSAQGSKRVLVLKLLVKCGIMLGRAIREELTFKFKQG